MSNKDKVVDEFLKKLELNGIKLNRLRAQGHKYEFNKKKINIKFDSYKRRPYWFDAAINDLNDMNFYIFICDDIESTYVIPSDFLRGKLEEYGRKRKSGGLYHFHIIVRDNVLDLYNGHKCHINEYKNKFSILN